MDSLQPIGRINKDLVTVIRMCVYDPVVHSFAGQHLCANILRGVLGEVN